MTTIISGMNVTNKMCLMATNGRVYATNDFDPVKVMTADVGYSAGITGPSGALGTATATAGNCTNGNHLIRYRYRDSRTGYVSNPSDALSVTVSGGNGTLTFDVTADYTLSTDTKVDTIDFEMTPVNDSVFYRAKSALNTATAVAVSIADTSLVQLTNINAELGAASTFDLFSHEVPPAGAVIVTQRNRSFIGVDLPYSITGSFINGTSTVSYANGSSKWVGRLLQASGDTVNYEIGAVNSTTITLTAVYAGTTAAKTTSVYKKLPNRIYYSRLNYPESFYAAFYARDMLGGRGDRLTAIWPMAKGLLCLGRYSGEFLVFDVDPSATTSNIIKIEGNRGVFNQRCIVEADGRLFAWDRQGIYEVGENPQIISLHVDPYLNQTVDYTYSSYFHGTYDPVERVLIWFFVATGDTVPKYAIVRDIDTDRWQTYRFLQGMTASCSMASSDGQVRAWAGDENGYTWSMSTNNSFDGVYTADPAALTVIAGSTITVINVSNILNTTVLLSGATAYLPATGEVRIISTNTASTVTVTNGFAAAPSANDEMWIGCIPFEYRTKWWAGEGMQNKKRPSYFYLMLFPGTATGKIQVYFYKDFSTQPYTWTPDASYTNSASDGITYPNNVMTIDLDAGSGDGFIAVNMPSDWSRAIQARLVSMKPDGTLRILDMGFKVGRKEEMETPNE